MDDLKKSLSDFLTNKPLYAKVEIPHHVYANAMVAMDGQTFDHYCENCKDIKTFKVERRANEIRRMAGEYTSHCFGICAYCNIYKMEITLNMFPDPKNTNNLETAKYYIRKIGQNPPYQIKPKKEINNYLNEVDNGYYSKGLMCISQSYGIAAFSYFRRIIENEMRRIVKDAAGLEMPELANQIRATEIIDESYKSLPESLKGLGYNPIKILWEQLSIGIHSLSEDECLSKAKTIEEVLSFVIEKINEENTTVKDIKEKLKLLQA